MRIEELIKNLLLRYHPAVEVSFYIANVCLEITI